MAWEQLPENYTDAAWSGLKRYNEINNEDGTVSFQDVTVYSHKEKSFFGAKDANRMNQALNIIMAMVENGTDLYTAFLEYFSMQKELFESNATLNMTDFEDYIATKKAEGDAIVDDLKTDYREEITEFETTQEQVFNTWFDFIKSQLGEDAAGNLQNQIVALRKYSDETFLSCNGGTMTGPVNMQGQTLSGLNVPTADDEAATKGYVDAEKTETVAYVNEQVKKATPRNLLDNSDFTNPVNQRGATSYTGAKYGIDRWVSEGGAGVVSIEDGSVNMKSSNGSAAYITQFIEAGKIKSGKIYTVACQLTDGSVWLKSGTAGEDMGSTVIKYMTYNGGEIGAIRLTYDTNKSLYKVMFNTTSTSGMDVVWVALYEGEYTDDSFPKYQSEGYSAKLLECQRYFYRYMKYTMHPGYKSNTIYATIYIPAIMRTTPTVTGTFEYRGTLTATDAATHTGSIGSATTESQGNTVRLIITEGSKKITNNQAIILMSYDVEISADL